jgi:hypothetical protein
MPKSSKLFLALSFPHQNPVSTCLLHRSRCILRQSHSLLHLPINIWWAVQIMKILVMRCNTISTDEYAASYTWMLPCTSYSQTPISALLLNTLRHCFSVSANKQDSHPHKKTSTDMYLFILIFVFLRHWMTENIPCVYSALNFYMNAS